MHSIQTKRAGLTLIETLVATAVLVMIVLVLYQVMSAMLTTARTIQTRTILTEIASQRIEFIRNLQYSDVGTTQGIPHGVVPSTMTIVQNGQSFDIATTIRNIDNPADGTLGGTPNDLSPADTKLVEMNVSCTSCVSPVSVTYNSIVAPKNLETETGNGVLILKVVDASGLPISGADVYVENNMIIPTVALSDKTDSHGILSIVDAPPSVQKYRVVVTKDGYSTEQTYPYGAPGNPDPTKPNLTVAAKTITQDTFAIDRLSTLSLKTYTAQCTPVGQVQATVTGTKLIGNPSVVKHIYTLTSDTTGFAQSSTIEWDTYTISFPGSVLRGSSPYPTFGILPGVTQSFRALIGSANDLGLGIAVADGAGIPIGAASISLTKGGRTHTYATDTMYYQDTAWTIGDTVASADPGVSFSVPGAVELYMSAGVYPSEAAFISNTIDLGENATPLTVDWESDTPSGTSVRFQIATNTDGQTWEFGGPDGTVETYFDTPANLSSFHAGHRYLRYRVVLATTNPIVTPSLSYVRIGYTNSCAEGGYTYIRGLSGSYSAQISKVGFATVSKTITIPHSSYEQIVLTPQ